MIHPWNRKYKYGPMEVEVAYRDLGRDPEGKHPSRIFDVAVRGRGREIVLPDYIPLHVKVNERSLSAMAHAAVSELAQAESYPEDFRRLRSSWPPEKIEEAIDIASFWGIAIHQAVNPMLDEIRRLDERERAERIHGKARGPMEWFPKRRRS